MKAVVNQMFTHYLDSNAQVELEKIQADVYLMRYQNRRYIIKVLNLNTAQSQVDLVVEGYHFSVDIIDELKSLILTLEQKTSAQSKGQSVVAPIPGVIRALFVENGQTVSQGSPVLLLEAMKMENMITMPQSGEVAHLDFQIGQSINKGDLLFSIL